MKQMQKHYRPFISNGTKEKLRDIGILTAAMVAAFPFYAEPTSRRPLTEQPMLVAAKSVQKDRCKPDSDPERRSKVANERTGCKIERQSASK